MIPSERREKRARQSALAELKKLRADGQTYACKVKIDESENEEIEDSNYERRELYMHSSDDDFIEYVAEPVRKDPFAFLPGSRNTRRSIGVTDSKTAGSLAAESVKDTYFQLLVAELDGDEGSEEESPAKELPHGDNFNSSDTGGVDKRDELAAMNIDDISAFEGQFESIPQSTIGASVPLMTVRQEAIQPQRASLVAADTNSSGYTMMQVDPDREQEELPMDTSTSLVVPTNLGPFNMTAEDGSVNFYWLDAYERTSGSVFLFGKFYDTAAKTFVSCCTIVQNLRRNLYFLPRQFKLDQDGNETNEEVTIADLHQELAEIAARFKIGKFGCKKVERKYAFEVAEVPVEADYIKMICSYQGISPHNYCINAVAPTLPANLTGRTFSHVFGTTTMPLEMLLIKRKIMGPCWLNVKPKSMAKRNISWCKVEIEVDDPKHLMVVANGPDAPPVTVMSLALRTIVNTRHHMHEIVAASALIFHHVPVDAGAAERPKPNAVFTVVRELENLPFPAKFAEALQNQSKTKLEQAKTERALLNYLIAMIHRFDPDVLVGHNFFGFDLGVLLQRMKACKVESWSRLGRLKWSQWPKSKIGTTEASFAERQIDLVKSKSYSLQQLVKGQLDIQREDLDYEKVPSYFKTPDQLLHLLHHLELDAYYSSILMFQLMVLPLTKQLTNLAGNLWGRTLTGARAERNEFLLLHEFHNHKFICPDKIHAQNSLASGEDGNDYEKKEGRRKPAYAGGLVLEPKKGFYDKIVLLLDFNSLYPSIIQEYNICFTTVERDYTTPEAMEQVPPVPDSDLEQGLLPKILANLVARRRQVKSLMKNPKLSIHEQSQLHIRQQALKLTANSMYGCLGFTHSRFYAKPLAILITSKGREILQSTVDLVTSQCGLEIIYGDTDSIMIHTGTRDHVEAKKMAAQVKKVVNERYRLLELELDGVFQKLLLLKKKKYAAMIIEQMADGTTKTRVETKGLDLVRRDWCALSVEISNFVLDRIMSEESREEVVEAIHVHLRTTSNVMHSGAMDLSKFIIYKNLTKDPEAYADAKSQPHVMVAKRMRERGQSVLCGDTIPYVICTERERDDRISVGHGNTSSSSLIADRAFHPDDLKKDPSLRLDHEWYLHNQIHPPISRLCEHIEGTDSSQLASCLGLDPKKYNVHSNEVDSSPFHLTTLMTDEERFKDVGKFMVTCPTCKTCSPFGDLVRINGELVESCLNCSNPACRARWPITVIYYHLLGAIRSFLAEYYQNWQQCDQPACLVNSQRMRVYETRCVNDGCRGLMKPQISGQSVYNQLLYFKSLFDFEKAKTKTGKMGDEAVKMLRSISNELEPVRELIRQQIDQCSYPIIDLREIFGFAINPKRLGIK